MPTLSDTKSWLMWV